MQPRPSTIRQYDDYRLIGLINLIWSMVLGVVKYSNEPEDLITEILPDVSAKRAFTDAEKNFLDETKLSDVEYNLSEEKLTLHPFDIPSFTIINKTNRELFLGFSNRTSTKEIRGERFRNFITEYRDTKNKPDISLYQLLKEIIKCKTEMEFDRLKKGLVLSGEAGGSNIHIPGEEFDSFFEDYIVNFIHETIKLMKSPDQPFDLININQAEENNKRILRAIFAYYCNARDAGIRHPFSNTDEIKRITSPLVIWEGKLQETTLKLTDSDDLKTLNGQLQKTTHDLIQDLNKWTYESDSELKEFRKLHAQLYALTSQFEATSKIYKLLKVIQTHMRTHPYLESQLQREIEDIPVQEALPAEVNNFAELGRLLPGDHLPINGSDILTCNMLDLIGAFGFKVSSDANLALQFGFRQPGDVIDRETVANKINLKIFALDTIIVSSDILKNQLARIIEILLPGEQIKLISPDNKIDPEQLASALKAYSNKYVEAEKAYHEYCNLINPLFDTISEGDINSALSGLRSQSIIDFDKDMHKFEDEYKQAISNFVEIKSILNEMPIDEKIASKSAESKNENLYYVTQNGGNSNIDLRKNINKLQNKIQSAYYNHHISNTAKAQREMVDLSILKGSEINHIPLQEMRQEKFEVVLNELGSEWGHTDASSGCAPDSQVVTFYNKKNYEWVERETKIPEKNQGSYVGRIDVFRKKSTKQNETFFIANLHLSFNAKFDEVLADIISKMGNMPGYIVGDFNKQFKYQVGASTLPESLRVPGTDYRKSDGILTYVPGLGLFAGEQLAISFTNGVRPIREQMPPIAPAEAAEFPEVDLDTKFNLSRNTDAIRTDPNAQQNKILINKIKLLQAYLINPDNKLMKMMVEIRVGLLQDLFTGKINTIPEFTPIQKKLLGISLTGDLNIIMGNIDWYAVIKLSEDINNLLACYKQLEEHLKSPSLGQTQKSAADKLHNIIMHEFCGINYQGEALTDLEKFALRNSNKLSETIKVLGQDETNRLLGTPKKFEELEDQDKIFLLKYRLLEQFKKDYDIKEQISDNNSVQYKVTGRFTHSRAATVERILNIKTNKYADYIGLLKAEHRNLIKQRSIKPSTVFTALNNILKDLRYKLVRTKFTPPNNIEEKRKQLIKNRTNKLLKYINERETSWTYKAKQAMQTTSFGHARWKLHTAGKIAYKLQQATTTEDLIQISIKLAHLLHGGQKIGWLKSDPNSDLISLFQDTNARILEHIIEDNKIKLAAMIEKTYTPPDNFTLLTKEILKDLAKFNISTSTPVSIIFFINRLLHMNTKSENAMREHYFEAIRCCQLTHNPAEKEIINSIVMALSSSVLSNIAVQWQAEDKAQRDEWRFFDDAHYKNGVDTSGANFAEDMLKKSLPITLDDPKMRALAGGPLNHLMANDYFKGMQKEPQSKLLEKIYYSYRHGIKINDPNPFPSEKEIAFMRRSIEQPDFHKEMMKIINFLMSYVKEHTSGFKYHAKNVSPGLFSDERAQNVRKQNLVIILAQKFQNCQSEEEYIRLKSVVADTQKNIIKLDPRSSLIGMLDKIKSEIEMKDTAKQLNSIFGS